MFESLPTTFKFADIANVNWEIAEGASKGSIILDPEGIWHLMLQSASKSLGKTPMAQIAEYEFDAQPLGVQTSIVTITPRDGSEKSLRLELVRVTPEAFQEALRRPSKAEREAAERARLIEKKEKLASELASVKEAAPDSGEGEPLEITFAAQYLGGLPEAPKESKRSKKLHLHEVLGIGYGTSSVKQLVMTWDEVVSVEVTGDQVGERKHLLTLVPHVAVNALGQILSTGSADRAFFVIHRTDGAMGVWQVNKKSAVRIKATIHPLLMAVGIVGAAGDDDMEAPNKSELTDQLLAIQKMHAEGALSEEEFVAAKKKLLS